MSFKLYSTDDGHVPAWEYLPVSAIKPMVGVGLAMNSNGQLAASAAPTHICMRTEEDTVAEGTLVPCVKIAADQVWESVLYSDAAMAKVGVLADVDPSGRWVNADDIVKKNFLITYIEGTTMASPVRGRFVK